jgi:hypothetical protein
VVVGAGGGEEVVVVDEQAASSAPDITTATNAVQRTQVNRPICISTVSSSVAIQGPDPILGNVEWAIMVAGSKHKIAAPHSQIAAAKLQRGQ